jgi:hypothetical protein
MERAPKRRETSASPMGQVNIPSVRVQQLPGSVAADIEVPEHEVDELSVATLINFFRVLDRWDREAKPPC